MRHRTDRGLQTAGPDMNSMDIDPERKLHDADPGRPQRLARLVLVITLVGLGVWTVKSFLPALAWAAILTIAFWPLYQRARRAWSPGRHDIVLPLLFTLGVAIMFGMPFVILAVQAGREGHDLLVWVQGLSTSGIPVPEFIGRLPFGSEQAAAWWRDNLASPLPTGEILKRVNRDSLMLLTRRFGIDVAHRFIIFFFMLMTLFFMLRDGESLVRDLLRASGRLFGARGERIMRQMVSSVHGTVDGLVLVGIGEGIIMGIAYHIGGVPHPTLLGGVTAVAAMIPFAVFVVFIIVGLLLLAQGSLMTAIVIVALGSVVVLLADHLIRPALIGGATRLPFLWVLFGILGGVETWGVVGLFIGPALMAALILLWREFLEGDQSADREIVADRVSSQP